MRPYNTDMNGPFCPRCGDSMVAIYCVGICSRYGVHYHLVCAKQHFAVTTVWDDDTVCPTCGGDVEILPCNGPLGSPVLGAEQDPCEHGVRGPHYDLHCSNCSYEEVMEVNPSKREEARTLRRASC